MTKFEDENRRTVVQLYEEVANNGRLELLDEIAWPDHIEHNPFPQQSQGAEGLKQRISMVRAAFNPRFTIEHLVVEGDKVAVMWSNDGTHVGEWFGFGPTGKSVTTTGWTSTCCGTAGLPSTGTSSTSPTSWLGGRASGSGGTSRKPALILVAGGTGRLGTKVVTLLRRRGIEIRVLTRDPGRAAHLAGTGVEIVEGDVRDLAAVRRAVDGARTVISAIQGFVGTKMGSPVTIDRDGKPQPHTRCARGRGRAVRAGVSQRCIAESPAELMRMKYAAEQDLKASGLAWTIIRPTAYMETWCDVLGRPLLDKGKTQVFGRGRNPINWVSAADVSEFVALAILDPSMRAEVIEVGGPENLTMTAFVDIFRKQIGSSGNVGHIPPVAMRLMAVVMSLANPGMARQIQMGIVMDTRPQGFPLWLSTWLSWRRNLAGMDGNRTHPGRLSSAPQTVLKTAEGTSLRTSPAQLH